jgi:hypothetical protein
MGFSLRVLFESDLWLFRSTKPAQASLTLRSAGSLSRPQAAFVTRLQLSYHELWTLSQGKVFKAICVICANGGSMKLMYDAGAS